MNWKVFLGGGLVYPPLRVGIGVGRGTDEPLFLLGPQSPFEGTRAKSWGLLVGMLGPPATWKGI